MTIPWILLARKTITRKKLSNKFENTESKDTMVFVSINTKQHMGNVTYLLRINKTLLCKQLLITHYNLED